jgi:predicted MFS family arabinose efflux permease
MFTVSAGGMTSFYLLVSVVPMYAAAAGAGDAGAGLVTGALMATTVLGELVTPALVGRFGYRLMLAAGLVLLGAPALALPADVAGSGLVATVAVCLLRGFGLAILVTAGGALTAMLIPPARRGEGLGLSGIVVNVPAVAALPLGIWLVEHAGYRVVFLTGAAAALVVLAAVPGLPGHQAAPEQPVGVLSGLRRPGLRRPVLAFTATTTAAGVVVAFLPLALADAPAALAALALLLQSLAATGGRWLAGRHGDRHGPTRLFGPGILLAAAGMSALVLIPATPAAALLGGLLFGAGFGITQIVTLTLMLNRVQPSSYSTVSAQWNLAYDAGWGAGAVGFGLLVGATGYPPAFAVTAALVLAALIPARRDRQPAGGRLAEPIVRHDSDA